MASCGSCQAANNPTVINYPDTSIYRLGDSSRIMKGQWSQASFPQVPCPSPQVLIWQYFSNTLGWTAIRESTSSDPVRLAVGETNNQLANAGTFYTRNILFYEVGVWQLRMKMACGDAFVSVPSSQTVLAAPAIFLV